MTDTVQDPRAERGEWKLLPYRSQIEAVHMALLRTAKVLYFSGFRIAEAVKTETRVWYPKTGHLGAPPTPGDIFCAGHSFLPDGRLLSTGGTLEYRDLPPIPPWLVRALRPIAPFIVRVFGRFVKTMPTMTGPTCLYLFDPKTEQWTFAGDMEEGRWYPTNTTLPDGRILILSGTNEGGGFGSRGRIDVNRRIEVYSAEDGLRQVASIPSADPHFPSLYPRMFVLPLSGEEKRTYPAGKAFCAGEGAMSKFLDLSTWEWTDVAEQEFGGRHDGCVVFLPLRPPDYRARVLTLGGIQEHGRDATATETAELIDLGRQPYTWEKIDSLQDKRAHACAVLLPDGRVLAVGGNSRALFDNPVFTIEEFDPEERKWREVAPMSVPRGYHSTALLLPDGRVLTAGSTPFGPYELRLEVYSPGYLFKGPRPRITRAPESFAYGQPAEVSYEHTGDIRSVALMRPGAVTHSFDMDQRYVELRFDQNGTDRLTVEAPPDRHVAPPGFYMLFLLSEGGVPSEAKFVHLPVPT
jgi:hypothetical protein